MKINNHPLEGRQFTTTDGSEIDGNKIWNVESVHEMDIDGQKYLSILTWTPGSVPPAYRSHGQIDWENISLDESTEIGELMLNAINRNRETYKLMPYVPEGRVKDLIDTVNEAQKFLDSLNKNK